MLKNTDDLRIRELQGTVAARAPDPRVRLLGGSVRRDLRCTPGHASHPARHGRPPDRHHRTLLHPRHARRAGIRQDLLKVQRDRFANELEVVMRVYFEKPRTTVGWKGPITDPHMDGSFKINDGLRTAREVLLEHQRAGRADRHRVPRHDQPAIHCRPGQLGRDRRPHHGIAGAPRAGVGAVVPGGLQERHRRQRQDRRRCDQGRLAAAPFPVGDQGRPSRPSCPPPATRTATSSSAAARRRTMTPPACRKPATPSRRRGLAARLMIDASPRQQQQEAREPDPGLRGHRPPDRRAATSASSA